MSSSGSTSGETPWTEVDEQMLILLSHLDVTGQIDGNPEARAELNELWWRKRRSQEAERITRWAPTMTRGQMRKLERKAKHDEKMTADEIDQWFAAVAMTEPQPNSSEAEWNRWYRTPVWRMLSPTRNGRSASTEPRRARVGSARPRGRRSRRARSRRTSADDGDPDADGVDVDRPLRSPRLDTVEGLLVIPLDSFEQEVDYRLGQLRRRQ